MNALTSLTDSPYFAKNNDTRRSMFRLPSALQAPMIRKGSFRRVYQ